MKSKRHIQYEANKKVKVGEEIVCPICGEHFIKKQYSQAFCCITCKDEFWNNKQRGKRNAYFSDYNRRHPERLERICVGTTYDNPLWTDEHPFSTDALGQD